MSEVNNVGLVNNHSAPTKRKDNSDILNTAVQTGIMAGVGTGLGYGNFAIDKKRAEKILKEGEEVFIEQARVNNPKATLKEISARYERLAGSFKEGSIKKTRNRFILTGIAISTGIFLIIKGIDFLINRKKAE